MTKFFAINCLQYNPVNSFILNHVTMRWRIQTEYVVNKGAKDNSMIQLIYVVPLEWDTINHNENCEIRFFRIEITLFKVMSKMLHNRRWISFLIISRIRQSQARNCLSNFQSWKFSNLCRTIRSTLLRKVLNNWNWYENYRRDAGGGLAALPRLAIFFRLDYHLFKN